MNTLLALILFVAFASANCFDRGWPDTAAGDIVELPCNKTGSGKVTRKCTLHGWEDPDFSQCVNYIPCDENSNPKLLTLLSPSLMCSSTTVTYAMKCINNAWSILTSTFDCINPEKTSDHFVYHVRDYTCKEENTIPLVTLTYKNQELSYLSNDIYCASSESTFLTPLPLYDETFCNITETKNHAYQYTTSISPSSKHIEQFVSGKNPVCLPECNESTEMKTYTYDSGLITNQEKQQIVNIKCTNKQYIPDPLPVDSYNSVAILSYEPTNTTIKFALHKRGSNSTLYCGYRLQGSWPVYPKCTDVFSNETTYHSILTTESEADYNMSFNYTKNTYYTFYCCGVFEGKGFNNHFSDNKLDIVANYPSCPATTIDTISLPKTSAGVTATVACGSGYIGSITARCSPLGVWEKIDTSKCVKAVFCPSGLSHHIVFPDTIEKETASIKCSIGYGGQVTRQCLAGGIWANVENHCYSIPFCKADIYHGISWPSTAVNDTHTRTCPEGETGSMKRGCNTQGFWEVQEDNCVKIGEFCESATIGTYVFPRTAPNKNATLACIPKVLGSVTIYCNNGTFSDIYNTCHSDSQDCQPITESSFDWPETSRGSTATLDCPSTKKGSVSRLCSITGAWQPIQGQCQPLIQCPAEYHNGIDWPVTEADQSVELMCPYGFPARTNRRCSDEGIWDENDSVCLTPIPSCPQNTVSGITWPETSGNTTAVHACPTGYKGQMKRYCTIEGTWNTPQDNCLALTCPSEVTTDYTWPETSVDRSVSYPCWGDLVTGTVTRYCNVNQKWEAASYNCHYPCPSETLENIQYPKTKANTTISVSCPDGSSGFASRTCLASSQWTTPIVNCELLTCFADGRFPTTNGNQIVHVVCHSIFPYLGELTRECYDGKWKDVQGSCALSTVLLHGGLVILVAIIIALVIYAVIVFKRTQGDVSTANKTVAARGQKINNQSILKDSMTQSLI